ISQQVTTDQRGYQWIAGLHGAPNYYCHRVQPAFALWHRPYIQQYEQRLQDVVEDAFVPYWDWTTHQAQEQGIPDIFTAQTWTNPDTNAQEPNPLLTQPQTLIGRGSTARQPQDPANLVPLRAMVHDAMFAPDYVSFSTDLENPHNSLHMWVGGDMGNIAYAAYDPLFWSHHAFVEYVFCQWQDAHPNATRPPLSQQDLAPFSVTLDQIWDYKNLGYAYVPDNASPLTLSGVSAGPGAAAGNTLRSRATVAHFPLYTIDPEDIRRAEVVFDGLRRPEESLAVRIFADNDDATAQTPLDDPSYLGTRFFFGHGECSGAEGHCDPIPRDIYDLRPPHHYAPRQVRVNITKPLKRLIALRGDPDAKDASITLVAVDAAGNAIDDADLYFEGLSVVVR
ncbi:MAG: tyrosinase family protein, partial [Candidatus Eremiobacteraeota bacterium]|nr:tyrosinase family protein [Candidatus Eremiobacteraeota bacterium]